MGPYARAYAPALLYAVLLGALTIGMPAPDPVGDAGEYLAYVARFLRGAGPAIPPDEVPQLRADLAAVDPALAGWDVAASMYSDRFGRLHFVHFWLYSAIATPFVALAAACGLDPRAGFTLLHASLLLVALQVLSRKVGGIVALFLVTGPILWWIDKPHPEAFLFALISIAFAWWNDRPLLALVCAGLAGAQVTPLGIFVPLLIAAALFARAGRWREASFWIAAAAGAGLALSAPLFYLWRFGELSLFARLSAPHWPWAHFGTEVFDLTVGLVPNWPMFGAGVVAALMTMATLRRGAPWRPDLAVAALGAVLLLIVFPQIGNVTHGGTPGMSRYGLWLVPLAIPLFVAANGARPWVWASFVLAALSIPYSIVHFHPARAEFSHRPTPIALWIWRHHPGWSTPRPRVFVNSLRAPDETAPAAAPGCTKALLIGRGEAQGMWPRGCAPAEVPPECRSPGQLCYADRHGLAYRFTPVDSTQANFKYDPRRVWPKSAEAAVRSAMTRVEWQELDAIDPAGPSAPALQVAGAQVESLAQRDGRLFAVLRHAAAGARLLVRHEHAVRGALLDGETGDVIREFSLAASADGSTLTIDDAKTTVVVALRPR